MMANLGLHCSRVTNAVFGGVFWGFFFGSFVFFFFFHDRLIYERTYAYSRFPLSEQKITSD